MIRTFLKSKLQEVTVTDANEEYEGSITIDEDLMDAMGLAPYEQVHVNGKVNPSRIITYAIPGERGSGIIALNGGASKHFKVGDRVHVLCFGGYRDGTYRQLPDNEYGHKVYEIGLPKPIIIKTDPHNKVIR